MGHYFGVEAEQWPAAAVTEEDLRLAKWMAEWVCQAPAPYRLVHKLAQFRAAAREPESSTATPRDST